MSEAQQMRTPLAAWYALATLSIVTLYAVIDGQVVALLAQSLKTDLHLTDTQLGSLRGLGAVLFGAIAVVPLGWLADRIDRRLVLAVCILVWSGAVASCGQATGYWSLLVCMAFLAAGEAGLSPIVYALIPELFPERRRITANFIFYAATIVGGGAGLAIVGAIIDHISSVAHWLPNGLFTRESWRLVFFVVAVPGPFLALAIGLIRLKRQDPQAAHTAEAAHTTQAAEAPHIRARAAEQGRAAEPPSQERPEILGYLATHWQAVVGIFAPFGLVLLGVGAVFTWLPVILMRQFALSAGAVGSGMGAAVAIGSVVGLTLAVVGAKFLTSKWGAATPIRMAQLGYFVLGLLTLLYFVARSPTEIFVIAGVQMAAVHSGNSLLPTIVQDLAPAKLRGQFFAISTLIATVFQVVSPIAVGLLSDHVFTRTGGLLLAAITVATPSLLLSALTLRLAEKRVLMTAGEVRALANAA